MAAFEPHPSPEALREHGHDDIRWWTLDELAETTEDVSPTRLATLAFEIVRGCPPLRPIDVGV